MTTTAESCSLTGVELTLHATDGQATGGGAYPSQTGPQGRRRRRSATGTAQAQRVAFGREWGAYTAAVARRLREETK